MVCEAFGAALQMSHLVAALHLFSPKHNSRESVLPGQQGTRGQGWSGGSLASRGVAVSCVSWSVTRSGHS